MRKHIFAGHVKHCFTVVIFLFSHRLSSRMLVSILAEEESQNSAPDSEKVKMSPSCFSIFYVFSSFLPFFLCVIFLSLTLFPYLSFIFPYVIFFPLFFLVFIYIFFSCIFSPFFVLSFCS